MTWLSPCLNTNSFLHYRCGYKFLKILISHVPLSRSQRLNRLNTHYAILVDRLPDDVFSILKCCPCAGTPIHHVSRKILKSQNHNASMTCGRTANQQLKLKFKFDNNSLVFDMGFVARFRTNAASLIAVI